jgi:hypothetical protein
VNYFPLTEASVVTYVTLQFENKDLQFQLRDGVQRATVNIFGKVTTMTRRPVMPFEATVSVDSPEAMLAELARGRSVYNAVLPLAPGNYRLDVAAKDAVSGSMTHYQAALAVPRLDPEKLESSGIVLTDVMEKVNSRSIGTGQFVVGDTKVRPRVDARFERGERLGIYCKAYHASEGTRADYEIVKTGTEERVYSGSDDLAAGRSETTLQRWVELRELEPGGYTVRVKVTDGRQTVTKTAGFTVL